MKRIATLCMIIIAAPSIYGQTCNGNACEFIRGDANCDGVVNVTDVAVIGNGTQTNDDAADVDDDGDVDSADATALGQYLTSSGPAPAAPFPSAGLDCTSDTLETCCSPPSSTSSPTTSSYDATLTNDEFDDQDETTSGVFESYNNNNCDHDDVLDTWTSEADIYDSTSFNYYRLDAGVQSVDVKLDFDVTFEKGALCTPCNANKTDWNYLVADFSTAYLVVSYDNPPGSGSITVYDLGLQQLNYNYRRQEDSYDDCEMVTEHSEDQNTNVTIDITDDLASALGSGSGCNEAQITGVKVVGVDLEFYSGSQSFEDIATTESIMVLANYDVIYGWCSN